MERTDIPHVVSTHDGRLVYLYLCRECGSTGHPEKPEFQGQTCASCKGTGRVADKPPEGSPATIAEAEARAAKLREPIEEAAAAPVPATPDHPSVPAPASTGRKW